jgi:antitoxin component YwqK of YwqJK toxin-antitoxin module
MDKSNIKCTIWFFDNGKKMCEEWTKEGDFYRSENKPAIVHYYENGKVSSESYFNNGLLTARIAYYKNGKISGKTIYIEGSNHTDTDYFEDGNISQEDYYINDLLVTRIRYNKNNQIKSKSMFVNGEEVKS